MAEKDLARVAVTACSLSCLMLSGAAGSTFTGLMGIDNGSSPAFFDAVSANGDAIVGAFYYNDGYRSFRLSPDGAIDLLEGVRIASGVSADGKVVVGDGLNSATGVWEPVRWTADGGAELLGGLPGLTLDGRTTAEDASQDGSVVVGYTRVNASVRAFRWTPEQGVRLLGFEEENDRSTAFAVSDDGSVIVGTWYRSLSYSVGFRWTESGGVTIMESPIPVFGSSYVSGISSDGNVVIGSAEATRDGVYAAQQAFRWTDSTGMTILDNKIGGQSFTFGVTGAGEAIVGSAGAQAVVWTESGGMERLSDVLHDRFGLGSQLEGWKLSQATAISDNGRVIVGYGVSPSGETRGWVARLDRPIFVPEPPNFYCVALSACFLSRYCMPRRAPLPACPAVYGGSSL